MNDSVLVLDAEGNNLGTMTYSHAKKIAFEQNLDLVEINKQNGSLVCKIMDRGKWQYQQSKQRQKNKHNTVQTKEIKIRPRIDSHDLDTKLNHVKRFIDKGHLVRFVVEMKGRERSNAEYARTRLDEVLTNLGDIVKTENRKETKSFISIMMHPNGNGHKSKE